MITIKKIYLKYFKMVTEIRAIDDLSLLYKMENFLTISGKSGSVNQLLFIN